MCWRNRSRAISQRIPEPRAGRWSSVIDILSASWPGHNLTAAPRMRWLSLRRLPSVGEGSSAIQQHGWGEGEARPLTQPSMLSTRCCPLPRRPTEGRGHNNNRPNLCDAVVISAFTRVFDALCPGHDESNNSRVALIFRRLAAADLLELGEHGVYV